MRTSVIFILFVLTLLCSCDLSDNRDGKLFRLLDSKKTGISFSNALEETNTLNILVYQDFYSGGGVSIGDIDNDGLSDVVFTGNQVAAKLYKNMGGMVFEDITSAAGMDHMGRGWYTGTAMVDINSDGWLDIYICKSGLEAPDDRANLLFINNGDGTFSERSKRFGLDHQGFAVNSSFFDYDKDGDLDAYLVNQGPIKLKSGNATKIRAEHHAEAGDVLYENMEGKFVDVTQKSGIYSSVIGFAHGVAIGDVNDDGWEDIFVSNDFFEHDYLYINNGDKTFKETIKQATRHISYYSMGNDMADFNNDGLLDIVVVDMVAEDNRRLYANLGGLNAQGFANFIRQGLHHQYMFNTLQLNNGNETFSEIGGLAGISKTDWSWAPLLADFDNDGFKDLFVSNGIRKDVRNIDWANTFHNMSNLSGGKMNFNDRQWSVLLNTMPSEKVANYMYKNNGDLTFDKAMNDWGMDQKSWSNGAAYGDMDNDGDLDLIVNNIDQEAFIYENIQEQARYIRFRFTGPEHNPMALGTKVRIIHGDQLQYQQHYLVRGYRSSMEPIMHFGTGRDTLISIIEVEWPDGKTSLLNDVLSNQVIHLRYADAKASPTETVDIAINYFEELPNEFTIDARHDENDMDDFRREPLLPYKLSALGPAFAVGDVNGDGLDDMFLGGSFRRPAQLFVQTENTTFLPTQKELWMKERMFEDIGAAFFDAEGDGDKDLFVVSGGNENTLDNGGLKDRLYLNDGTGNFHKSDHALPNVSGSVVVPADYDADGDLDLFVGGRMVPGSYPLPANSFLLENRNGTFEDITDQLAPGLNQLGMVTDGLWCDYDVDGDIDLVVVGEWMPVTIFQNESGKFQKISNSENGLKWSSGWWWSIAAEDFDRDGDPDFVVGNIGKNYKYPVEKDIPLEIFAHDYDNSGTLDLALGYHQHGKLYPANSRHKTLQQNSSFTKNALTNNEYALATLADIYGPENLEQSLHYTIHTLATSYIENLGNGKFEVRPLDNLAQISTVNTIIIRDVDLDGNEDLILAGNLYTVETETIRNDAGIGLWLRGDGEGNFEPKPYLESGLYLPGDVRHMGIIKTANGNFLVAARNNDHIQGMKINSTRAVQGD